jgi:serine phosphatase RsbU (regulator of sigma subunit)
VTVDTLVKASTASVHRLFLGALPYFIMTLVVFDELMPEHDRGLLPLLSLGPALASVSRRAIPTALIGVLALGICTILSWDYHFYHQPHGNVPFITIVGMTIVGVVASAGRQRRERELADIRAVAEIAQAVLLRPAPREVPGAEVAVRYMSATAAARIGGDLYEVVTTAQHVRIILGDVQGKGVAAVRTAAMVLGAFREAAYEARDLAEIAERIEQSMRNQAPEQEFVTAVLAELIPGCPVIEILNCGHPAPLLLRDGNAVPAESPDPCLPLGLASLTDEQRAPTTWPFGPGDQILFYTDGISEARDKAGAFYPLSDCGPILAGHDAEAALDLIKGQVISHVGHTLTDDAAMLLVKCTAVDSATAAPAVRPDGRGGHIPVQPVPAQPMSPGTLPSLDGISG